MSERYYEITTNKQDLVEKLDEIRDCMVFYSLANAALDAHGDYGVVGKEEVGLLIAEEVLRAKCKLIDLD